MSFCFLAKVFMNKFSREKKTRTCFCSFRAAHFPSMVSDKVATSFLNSIKSTASLHGVCSVSFSPLALHRRRATSYGFFIYFTGGFTRVFSLHVWVGNPSASRLAP